MKWLQSLPYLTLTGSGFMSCLGGGVAGFSQQTGTSSVLLCWHQGRDLRHQRGEAAFLALYLPQPLPWNSTNWTSYTVSPPSPPVSLSFLGLWELQSLDPRAFCTVAGDTTLPFPGRWAAGSAGSPAPWACHSRRVIWAQWQALTQGINVSMSLINTKSERAQHTFPITNPPLPWDVQRSCCGYYFLLLIHTGLVGWGWEFDCGFN